MRYLVFRTHIFFIEDKASYNGLWFTCIYGILEDGTHLHNSCKLLPPYWHITVPPVSYYNIFLGQLLPDGAYIWPAGSLVTDLLPHLLCCEVGILVRSHVVWNLCVWMRHFYTTSDSDVGWLTLLAEKGK